MTWYVRRASPTRYRQKIITTPAMAPRTDARGIHNSGPTYSASNMSFTRLAEEAILH